MSICRPVRHEVFSKRQSKSCRNLVYNALRFSLTGSLDVPQTLFYSCMGRAELLSGCLCMLIRAKSKVLIIAARQRWRSTHREIL